MLVVRAGRFQAWRWEREWKVTDLHVIVHSCSWSYKKELFLKRLCSVYFCKSVQLGKHSQEMCP